MARRKKKADAGVPEWVVTFGDMMSLLLTFFILLAAFSELKKPRELENAFQSIKVAFGITGGGGFAPINDPAFQSVIRSLIEPELQPSSQVSENETPGPPGPAERVTRMDEGMRWAVGVPLQFEPGSSELEPGHREILRAIARQLSGKNTKIEIRAHADRSEQLDPRAGEDLWALSYQRAVAVMKFLSAPEQGIDRQRLRLMALGDTEPRTPSTDPAAAKINRRVEIIRTESLIQEYQDRP